MAIAEHELLTPTQTAVRLGVSPQTVKNWRQTGKIVGLLTPLGHLYDAATVEQLAAERAAKTAPATADVP